MRMMLLYMMYMRGTITGYLCRHPRLLRGNDGLTRFEQGRHQHPDHGYRQSISGNEVRAILLVGRSEGSVDAVRHVRGGLSRDLQGVMCTTGKVALLAVSCTFCVPRFGAQCERYR